MKKMIRILCCFGAFCCLQTVFADSTTQLIHLLGQYTSYQANFREITLDETDQLLQKSQGKIYLQRPGRFRWETHTPINQIIVADGQTISIYDIDLEQVTIQRVGQGGTTNPAILLAGDVDHLAKQYVITTMQDAGRLWYVLTPKAKHASFKKVLLSFHDGGLVALRLQNNIGQTSIYAFDHVKLNQAIPASIFQLKVPKFVDVIRE